MRKKYFAKEDAKGEKRKAVFPVALILTAVCLTFVAYGRSLNGPLVLDDTHYLDPSKLEGSIGHFRFGVRFIPFVSFVLNYMLTGMNPVFFRITNIILHVISACLAFYLASLTMALPSMRDRFGEMPNGGASRSIPLAVCVLFLLHPIQTSAVNYITQRMAIMACMFSFAGFISYVKGGLSRGRKSLFLYGLSALFFVFAIFSKENAVMVLPMLPLYDLLFLSSFQWKEFKKRFIPLVLLFAALGVMVISHLGAAGFTAKIISVVSRPDQPLGNYGWTGIDIQWTPKEYVLTELRIVSRYIILLLFPNPSWLVFDHANAYPVSTGLLSPVSTFFSLLFLLSLLFLSVRYVKRVPLISFGILWYLVTITLESFIALGLDPYFEHRNYLPSFGAFLSLASLLGYADRLGVGARGSRVAGEGSRRVEGREVVLCIATVLLFLMTFARNGVWTTDDLLWRDTLRKSPQNPRALTSLSSICLQQQKFREAEDYIQRASKIPHMSHVFKTTMLINEASLYKETNRKQEAVAILKGLIAERGLSEADPSALYLMGEILREEGKPAEAKDYLTRANAKRRSPLVLISLGLVSRSLGETGDAE